MSNEKLADLLRDCLSDYSHPNFTDRYGMADRIRGALQAHAAEAELAALKARIAGGELGVVAGPMKYSQAPVIFAEPDRAMALIGQRVALV